MQYNEFLPFGPFLLEQIDCARAVRVYIDRDRSCVKFALKEAGVTSNYISYDNVIDLISWQRAIDALRSGHRRPKAQIADLFLGPPTATLLNGAAFIEGFDYGITAVTVMDGNPGSVLNGNQQAGFARESHNSRKSDLADRWS
ncbi:hypothetical protein [Haliea sp.]